MASTFPDTIDTIPLFIDVEDEDIEDLKLFQSSYVAQDYETASSYLNQIADVGQKIFTADRFNKLRDAILQIEYFYKNDIAAYITNKQTEWQATIDQFSYISVYSETETYLKTNIVYFNDNGLAKLYIALADCPIGKIPNIDTAYWAQFTIQGEQGDSYSTVSTTFAFDWSSSTSYGVNTIVYYDHAWYISILASSNKIPSDSTTTYWSRILDVTYTFVVDETQPTTQTTGELWFEVLAMGD